jgi:hypothetical protein
MRRLFAFVLLGTIAWGPRLHAQVKPALTLDDVHFLGYSDALPNGNDSGYTNGFTTRRVNGDLRFLFLAHTGILRELAAPSAPGTRVPPEILNQWDLTKTGVFSGFNGIWYESEKDRLWVTSSEDYTNVYRPAHVATMTLQPSGVIANVKTITLKGIPEKRVYGGCQRAPADLAARFGAYVCGWGGYTSLVAQAGGASIGPTMYGIPDPAGLPNGAAVSPKVILDTSSSRGVRKTLPVNYFDGGDPRQNPPTRPSSPPSRGAGWLSPARDGLGWFVWGDSYYGTGMMIDGPAKRGFVLIASLCQGSCWYQSSTLEYDGRQFEMHMWDVSKLGSNVLRRPDAMVELALPRGNPAVWGGNAPIGNINGASYDPVTSNIYATGCPFGDDVYTCRVFTWHVNAGGE